jgi:hypothetical protein
MAEPTNTDAELQKYDELDSILGGFAARLLGFDELPEAYPKIAGNGLSQRQAKAAIQSLVDTRVAEAEAKAVAAFVQRVNDRLDNAGLDSFDTRHYMKDELAQLAPPNHKETAR